MILTRTQPFSFPCLDVALPRNYWFLKEIVFSRFKKLQCEILDKDDMQINLSFFLSDVFE